MYISGYLAGRTTCVRGWSESEVPLYAFVERSRYRGEWKRLHGIIPCFIKQKSNLARIIPQPQRNSMHTRLHGRCIHVCYKQGKQTITSKDRLKIVRQLQSVPRAGSSGRKRAWKKAKPKKIFSRAVPDTQPGLVQQTVQIVVRSALTI